MAATPRAARASRTSPTHVWLWGGTPEAIAETIRVGINSAHPDTRVSQMLAFGRDGMLKRDEIENVVAYVAQLSDPRRKAPAGNDRGRQGGLRRQLRRLSRRRRQGQAPRSARPT